MSLVEPTQSILGEYLELFAHTEIFIFVFIEIVTKIETIQRVIFKKARLSDYIVFIIIFGLFSIFGTYVGTSESYGAITNIRDLAPMVAGLVGGPVVGLAVGLIGGIHRSLLGGMTWIPCSLATILAGLLAGMIYRINKGKLLGILPSILFAAAIEFLHGGLVLLLISPFNVALEIFLANIPQMIIAVSLGMGISVIIINSTKEFVKATSREAYTSQPTHETEAGSLKETAHGKMEITEPSLCRFRSIRSTLSFITKYYFLRINGLPDE